MKEVDREMDPNGKPLEEMLDKKRCARFMFMGRVNGINPCQHGMARMLLNLDDSGQCHISTGRWGFEKADFPVELGKLETALREFGRRPWRAFTTSPLSQRSARLYNRRAFPSHESKFTQKTYR